MVDRADQRSVLLSIRPEFVRRILEGTKTVELRRTKFARPVSQLVIYATSPVKRIVAIATLDKIISKEPSELWKQLGEETGISEDLYFSYFEGCDMAVGLLLEHVAVFQYAFPPEEATPGLGPPQSFRYLSEGEERAILSLGAPSDARNGELAPLSTESGKSGCASACDLPKGHIFHVLKRDPGEWHVARASGKMPTKTYATKREAVTEGRKQAREVSGRLLIHNTCGSISRHHDYGD